MATISRRANRELVGNPLAVINAVRQTASVDFKNAVPYATEDASVLKSIGAILIDNPLFFNEFVNGLVNRIGKVIFSSEMTWTNPLGWVTKGMLEFGETVEDIYVGLCDPHKYDPAVADTEWMNREIPDVKAAFYPINLRMFYKTTIERGDVARAFTNVGELDRFIAQQIGAQIKSAEYDTYQATMYMLATAIQRGVMVGVEVPAQNTVENMETAIAAARSLSTKLTIPSRKYNIMGVYNETPKERQRIFINADYEGTMDVKILASAFNMDKAEFIGQRTIFPGFAELDVNRLDKLFQYGTPNADKMYHHFTAEELAELDNVPMFVVDSNWFQCYDALFETATSPYNSDGLYFNNTYHIWKVMATSPFANAVMFVAKEQSITSVSLNTSSLSLVEGSSIALTPTVVSEGYATKAVVWESDDEDVATVDDAGMVTAVGTGSATITCTSIFDDSKKDTCEVTVS